MSERKLILLDSYYKTYYITAMAEDDLQFPSDNDITPRKKATAKHLARRKNPKSAKQLKAAELRAQGKTFDEVAEGAGYAHRASARTAVNTVLNYKQFEDIKGLRLQVEVSLQAVKSRLYKLAGIRDPFDEKAQQPPKVPATVLAGEREMTIEEKQDHAERCKALGLDAWGDPLTVSEPAQMVGACRALVALEKRRCSIFGVDSPKFVVPAEGKQIADDDYEGLASECRKYDIPVPPGIKEILERRRVQNGNGSGNGHAAGVASNGSGTSGNGHQAPVAGHNGTDAVLPAP